MDSQTGSDAASTIVNSTVQRTREYLTGSEVEALMAAARKSSRYGHRDATMILIAKGPAAATLTAIIGVGLLAIAWYLYGR